MIFNLTTSEPELPENWTPLEAVAVIKCLDEEGSPCFAIRSTETLSGWEAVGLLEVAAKAQINDILGDMEDG